MVTRKQRLLRSRLTVALLLSALISGCTTSAPVAGPTQVSLVTLDELPSVARFAEIGNIGQAYRLQTTLPANVRFPASQQHTSALLTGTIRLFHFDEQQARWTEVADSRFDGQTSELVGSNLAPGLYTAFGWSANPVENALQRLIFDAQRGFRNEAFAFASLDELRQGIASTPVERQPQLLHDFIQLSVSLEQTTCHLVDNAAHAACSEACRDLARPRQRTGAWGFCPRECRQPECCDCESFTVTERVWIPESMVRPALQPCPGWQNGQLCPLCERGLSCPTRAAASVVQITPNSVILEHSVMHRVGLGPVAEEPGFRSAWHTAIEQILGRRYGDPSPQPSG